MTAAPSVVRRGAGEPVVLLHGLGSRWQVFEPLLDGLATTHEVIALDLPGFGARSRVPGMGADVDSYATWVVEWLASTGIERPHLVGSSLGGGIALEVARRGVARSATVFSPIGFQRGPGRLWSRFVLGSLHLVASTLGPALAFALRARAGRTLLLGLLFGRPGQVPAEAAIGDARALGRSPAFRDVLRAHGRFRVDEDLAAALRDVPVTVAWGTRDALLVHATQAARARRLLPTAHHVRLEGCGHLPFADDPSACTRAVLRATARAAAVGSSGPTIVVIGAGLGGLATAIACRQAGYDDLVVLEKADDVGGVWRDNTYPGAACDVPSPAYSYSFAPNPGWPRRFSPQEAILDYIRTVVDTHDLRRHLRTGSEVTGATFDEATGRWSVHLADGAQVEADVVVTATGQLSRPVVPAIPGRDRFAGAAFHTARWDHDVELSGRRVAVVGTGASAVQVVPAIADRVGHLEVFQRSAPYLLPRPDRTFSASHRRLFARVPAVQRLGRLVWLGLVEVLSVAWVYAPPLRAVLRAVSAAQRRQQTRSVPGLAARVRPTYPIGCKRILFSSDYLPTLTRDHVTLTTERIREVVPEGLVTDDGHVHEADVIVWATGFDAATFLGPMVVTGRGGRRLEDAWADGAHAYYGLTVPDFPGLLVVYGPNTNTGGGSIIAFLETQAAYVADYVRHVAELGSPLDVRRDVERAFDERVQRELRDSVWARCDSWYRRTDGRITTNWPRLTPQYRAEARFDPRDYVPVARVGDRGDGRPGSATGGRS